MTSSLKSIRSAASYCEVRKTIGKILRARYDEALQDNLPIHLSKLLRRLEAATNDSVPLAAPPQR